MPFGPNLLIDPHLSFHPAQGSKQFLHRLGIGAIDESEEPLKVILLSREQQFPFFYLFEEESRKGNREPVEDAFVDEGLKER